MHGIGIFISLVPSSSIPNLTKLSKLFVDCAQTLCKCLLTLADYKIHQFLNWTQSKLQETKCCVSGLGRHREFSLYQSINVVCELIDLCRWGWFFLLYFANSEKSEVWRKANGVLTKDDTEIKLLLYYCGIRDASCHGSSVCSLHPVPKECLRAVPRAQEGCRQGAVVSLCGRSSAFPWSSSREVYGWWPQSPLDCKPGFVASRWPVTTGGTGAPSEEENVSTVSAQTSRACEVLGRTRQILKRKVWI